MKEGLQKIQSMPNRLMRIVLREPRELLTRARFAGFGPQAPEFTAHVET